MKKPPQRQHERKAQTSGQILQAATKIFAQSGFDGARVDEIAAEAGVNKQRLYHYFGDKDGLFTAVLEEAYRQIRAAEAKLDLAKLTADQAVLELVEFTWRYYLAHPEFIRLLNSENQLEARHIKGAKSTRSINSGHIELMRQLIRRGAKEKTMRSDLDPVHLSVNISALSFFYLMNRHTLSTVFERDFMARDSLASRLSVMKDIIARWISPTRAR